MSQRAVAEHVNWNMFRRRAESFLWCAVPADFALPSFLFSGEWIYSGQRPCARDGLPGISPAVAAHGAALSGFYLFHSFRSARVGMVEEGAGDTARLSAAA